jgi:hypothetical protein
MKRTKLQRSEQKPLVGGDQAEMPPGLTRLANGLLVTDEAASEDLVRYAATLQADRIDAGWIMGDLVVALENRGAIDVCARLERGVWKKERLATARRVALRFPLETRSFPLSYTHYREVGTKLNGYPSTDLPKPDAARLMDAWMERARHWLQIAVAEELSCDALQRRIIESQEGRAKIVTRDLIRANRSLSKTLQSIADTPALNDTGRLSAVVNDFHGLAQAIEERMFQLLGQPEENNREVAADGANAELKFQEVAPAPVAESEDGVLKSCRTQPQKRPDDALFGGWRPSQTWQPWSVVAAAAVIAVTLFLPAALDPSPATKIVVAGLQDAPRRVSSMPPKPRKQPIAQTATVELPALFEKVERVAVRSTFSRVTELNLVPATSISFYSAGK